MNILTNHIGYARVGPKKAIIDAGPDSKLGSFSLVEASTGAEVFSGPIVRSGTVDGWKDLFFWVLDFSDFTVSGRFRIEVAAVGRNSAAFRIGERVLEKFTLQNVVSFFVSQHTTGRYEKASRTLPVYGRSTTVDAHGGWYDASGDNGQYLGHLSHSNYLNPQQTPMAVWSFLAASEAFADFATFPEKILYYSLMDEAAHGGDFLVRMKDPEGYFFKGILNPGWKDPTMRKIEGISGDPNFLKERTGPLDRYMAAYRDGAGIAIASLARLSTKETYGDFDATTYLATAIEAFDHLERYNRDYCYDGKENIIDDYCCLLAATELFAATGAERYRDRARLRAKNLMNRQVVSGPYPGHLLAAEGRPFYHPVEAGLPCIALLRYIAIADSEEEKAVVRETVLKALRCMLALTEEVNNPFGYARQYVKALGEDARSSFFMPHDNETLYWWQGENATIASQAALALMACGYFAEDTGLCAELTGFAIDQLNWILGLNPFDFCMLHGRGHNTDEYADPLPPVLGGICNGVTAGHPDESDIAFAPETLRDDPRYSWRWTEQWIPHSFWYILALSLMHGASRKTEPQ